MSRGLKTRNLETHSSVRFPVSTADRVSESTRSSERTSSHRSGDSIPVRVQREMPDNLDICEAWCDFDRATAGHSVRACPAECRKGRRHPDAHNIQTCHTGTKSVSVTLWLYSSSTLLVASALANQVRLIVILNHLQASYHLLPWSKRRSRSPRVA